MQDNVQQSKVVLALKKIWPTIYRVINTSVYFLLSLIRTFFKDVMRSITGK